jgi:hypothetical protein
VLGTGADHGGHESRGVRGRRRDTPLLADGRLSVIEFESAQLRAHVASGDPRGERQHLLDRTPASVAVGSAMPIFASPHAARIRMLGRITGISSDPITRIPHPWVEPDRARGGGGGEFRRNEP